MDAVSQDIAWLKAQRARLGWSTTDVAKRAREAASRIGEDLNLTQQSISHFENFGLKKVPRWMRFVRDSIRQADAASDLAEAELQDEDSTDHDGDLESELSHLQSVLDIPGKLAAAGARLRSERLRLDINQSKMAEIGGVNRNSQSDYEAGKRPWSVAYMFAIRGAGVDVGFLLTGRRASEQLEDDETELLSCFRQLDPGERAAVIQVARSMAGRKAPSSRIHAEPLAFTSEPMRRERR